jgi:hypothetical protein
LEFIVRRWLLCFTISVLLAATALGDDDLDAVFGKDILIIEASRHACYRFDIYLATSNEQRRRGLMFVRSMPQMTGMLFVYGSPNYYSMWMKNTFIPLDMVFARQDGTISSIERHTEPQSLRSLAAIEPVVFVLELNAGITEQLYIDENSRLIWAPTEDTAE